MLGGVFERHPAARLILGHIGETLPYILWRLDRRSEAFRGGAGSKPSEVFKRQIFITTAGVCSDESLACALGATGPDNTMFSVDHLFESMDDAGCWLDAAPLMAEVRAKVSSGYVSRRLKL